jgi:FADH2 O2-dependent halogenase
MSHTAGFVDPLFARDLPGTFEVAHALIRRVDQALRDDDFSADRFAYVEEVQRGLLRFSDLLANSSAIAFENFRLWHAFFRVWGGFRSPGMMRLTRARVHFQVTGDPTHLDALEHGPHHGMWWPESTTFTDMLEAAAELLEKYEAGAIEADAAADQIFAMTRDCDLVPPAFGWKNDENTRFYLPTQAQTAKFMYWATRQVPPGEMRDLARSLISGVVRATAKGEKLH